MLDAVDRLPIQITSGALGFVYADEDDATEAINRMLADGRLRLVTSVARDPADPQGLVVQHAIVRGLLPEPLEPPNGAPR